MARFPFLQRGNLAEQARQLNLTSYTPLLTLEGLLTGVDNLRHDVYLTSKFTDPARAHLGHVIAHYGNVAGLVGAETRGPVTTPQLLGPRSPAKAPAAKAEPGDFKRLLAELHVMALNRAKAEGNISIDLLARVAITKFLRAELAAQFAQVLERCRTMLKGYDSMRGGKALELRERVAAFQVSKKSVLRRAGQDLFQTLREIEKETLARMRRSLFGDAAQASYELFLNRLLYTEDGRDDYLNAEHYVMMGNYDRDPDRFVTLREIAYSFLRSLDLGGEAGEEERVLDGLLNAPENAQELVAAGVPDDSTPRGKAQRALLAAWLELLESAAVMEHVVAAYEVVPLLAEYSPPINAQQLKNALIAKAERSRVEQLIEEQGKLSLDNLDAAVRRVAACRGTDRAKMAGRFLADFLRYHRDLRRMEAMVSAMDSVNVIGNEKLRELSSVNNTLYEFLLPDEQKQGEERVIHHVVLKADIRDSTRLTRTLSERGLNPASYFSLNFYDPVNKLLPKYAAHKVFLEGDAMILALLEKEGEPEFAVARTCVLAREITDLVRGYNEQSQKAGLPTLELGVGISYQDSAPMYLMDGNSPIMISDALNESDRLSSCSKAARKFPGGRDSLFNVYSFQTLKEAEGGMDTEFLLKYNIGGIHMSSAAFRKLQQEISLQAHELSLPNSWASEPVRLYSGLVPLGAGIFHKVVVREARVAHIDARDFSLKNWTSHFYYEVCTHAAVYQLLEKKIPAKAGQ